MAGREDVVIDVESMMAGLNHPADQLAMVREKIKALQREEEDLKAMCRDLPEEERMRRYYEAAVRTVTRRSLDTRAMREAFSEDELERFMKESTTTSVVLKEMGGE